MQNLESVAQKMPELLYKLHIPFSFFNSFFYNQRNALYLLNPQPKSLAISFTRQVLVRNSEITCPPNREISGANFCFKGGVMGYRFYFYSHFKLT